MYYHERKPGALERFAPRITRNLIFINVIVWIAQMAFPRALGLDLTDLLGLHYWQGSSFRLYQLVSYMFLHSTDGFIHILSNMFMLWMFGSVIERFWGERRFIIFYLITGITAGLTQEIVWSASFYEMTQGAIQLVDIGGGNIIPLSELLNMPLTVGASGAIFGLLLAYGMLFPNTAMYYMFIPIPIKAKYLVVLFGLYELFSGVHASGSNVAHFAHLGGMIGGIVLILLWRKKGIISGPYN